MRADDYGQCSLGCRIWRRESHVCRWSLPIYDRQGEPVQACEGRTIAAETSLGPKRDSLSGNLNAFQNVGCAAS
eukprot:6174233-Pleurochrysis_carterae.AAC.2